MIKNLHREYAECVHSFCKSIPPILQVTTEEVDTYFRSCALYLWASGEQPGDIFGGANLLYTDRQVKLTRQEFEEQTQLYSSNPHETISVPDFFLRMLSADRVSGNDIASLLSKIQGLAFMRCHFTILSRSFQDRKGYTRYGTV